MALPTWPSNWQGCRAGSMHICSDGPPGENRVLKVRRGWCRAPEWSVRGGAWGSGRVGQMSAMTPSGDYFWYPGGPIRAEGALSFSLPRCEHLSWPGTCIPPSHLTMTVTILSVWWHPLSGSSHRHKAHCFRTFAMRLREAGRCQTCQSSERSSKGAIKRRRLTRLRKCPRQPHKLIPSKPISP